MKILKSDLKFMAKSILLDIDDNELDKIYHNFQLIVDKLRYIKYFNLENVSPLDYLFEDKYSKLREDELIENLDKKDVLKNAKSKSTDFITIKKEK